MSEIKLRKVTSRHSGSSWHGHSVWATPNEMMKIADSFNIEYYKGNDGQGKTNFDFLFEIASKGNLEDGIQFTAYDWKNYRQLKVNEEVNWHIGAFRAVEGAVGEEILKILLENLRDE